MTSPIPLFGEDDDITIFETTLTHAAVHEWICNSLDSSTYSALRVLRHFAIEPFPHIFPLFEFAAGIVVDLEFYPQNPQNIVPELEGKVTQIGYTVFPMGALGKCKTPADFPALLKTATTHYIRVIENYHLRAKSPKFGDVEKNSFYCPTRCMTLVDAKAFLEDLLDNQLLEDGSKAPVVLIGDNWHKHEAFLKHDPAWKLNTFKIDSIVFKIKSLGHLAAQAGIVPFPESFAKKPYPYLDEMFPSFDIDLAGMYPHNGGNGAVYQMTLVFLIAHFAMLYPTTAEGFPKDSSIAGRSLDYMLRDLQSTKDTMPALERGVAQFCFYCEAANDHDAENCPVKSTIICKYCANAMGKKNAKYRQKAKGHNAERCIFRYHHDVRKFPDWLGNLKCRRRICANCHMEWPSRTSRLSVRCSTTLCCRVVQWETTR
jgi:hypothetical protein